MEKYEYITVSMILDKSVMTADTEIKIPDGRITNIGIVQAGNNENRIINFSILENNNTLLQPSDLRFSEKSSGGTFKDSLRPVDLSGGRILQVRLTALQPTAGDDITVQVLFMIQKPGSIYES